jgi:hypothetical protein
MTPPLFFADQGNSEGRSFLFFQIQTGYSGKKKGTLFFHTKLIQPLDGGADLNI